jgi:hypothetical protein
MSPPHHNQRHRRPAQQPKTRLPQHILAAYFSDARLNIFDCLKDICEKTGVAPRTDEAHNLAMLDSLNLGTTTPELRDERMDLLRLRFPFLNPMTDTKLDEPDAPLTKAQEAQQSAKKRQNLDQKRQHRAESIRDLKPADFEHRLRALFRLVHELRNTFMHPNEAPVEIGIRELRHLFFNLGKVYDGALNEVERRFELPAAAKQGLLRKGNGGKLRRLDDAFSLAICQAPAAMEERLGADARVEATDALHDFGLVLLCALFLDKRQSADLIAEFWAAGWRVPYDRRPPSAQQSATTTAMAKELIAVYRARPPVRRLRSDESAAAITLDALSELSRCPRELFDALPPAQKQRFRSGSSPANPDGPADREADDPDVAFLMTRKRDRFVPLMLRLLDLESESRLRFAIDLGQYFFHVCLKPGEHFTDGTPRVRHRAQKVIGYGRLRDFLDADKPPTWQALEANRAKLDELVQPARTSPARTSSRCCPTSCRPRRTIISTTTRSACCSPPTRKTAPPTRTYPRTLPPATPSDATCAAGRWSRNSGSAPCSSCIWRATASWSARR